jgi:hypothetical protein
LEKCKFIIVGFLREWKVVLITLLEKGFVKADIILQKILPS